MQVGEFDTMSQECSQQVVDSLPHAFPLVMIPRASHCKLIDEPKLCNGAIFRFLNTVEAIRDLERQSQQRKTINQQ